MSFIGWSHGFRAFVQWIVITILFCVVVACSTERQQVRKLAVNKQTEELVAVLDESDKNSRIDAIKALGELRDPRSITALSKRLTAESWVEREAAVVALSNISDYLVLKPLFDAAGDDDKFVRESAEVALNSVTARLGRKRDPRMIKHIAAELANKNIRSRNIAAKLLRTAIRSLRNVDPTEYLKYIVAMLDGKNRYARRSAAIIMREINNAAVYPPLFAALKDPIRDVREAASDSLLALDDPDSLDIIVTALLADDEFSRRQAALLLIKYRKDEYNNNIIALLSHANPNVREASVNAVKNWSDNTYIKNIEPLLEDSSARVRLAAAETLGEFGWKPESKKQIAIECIARQDWQRCQTMGEVIIAPLLVASQDSDPEVRSSAGKALVESGWQPKTPAEKAKMCVIKQAWEECVALGESAVLPLVNELTNYSASVRADVINALGSIGSSTAIPYLVTQMSDSDQDVRRAVVDSFSKYKSKLIIKPLIDALDDPSRVIRLSAVNALEANLNVVATTSDIRDVQPIINALSDNNRYVRKVAATILGEINNIQVIPPLIAALKDEDAMVRKAASEALHKTKSPAALGTFLKGLTSDNIEVRKQAVIVVGDFKDVKLLAHLEKMLKDPILDVRIEAVIAVGKQNDKRAVDLLIKALHDIDAPVREKATLELGHYNLSDVNAALLLASADSSLAVRNSARQQLLKLNWKPGNQAEKALLYITNKEWNDCAKLGIDALRPLLIELAYDDAPDKSEIIKVLGKIGNPQAVDAILNTISQTQWIENEEEREKTIRYGQRSLRQIGKPSVSKLTSYLTDWYMGQYVADALTTFGWKTHSETDLIHFLLAKRDIKTLKNKWPITKKVLLKDMASNNEKQINNALYALIGLGNPDVLAAMIEILQKKGSVHLAEAYLNSENEKLESAAKSWISDNDYTLLGLSKGNQPVVWGKL